MTNTLLLIILFITGALSVFLFLRFALPWLKFQIAIAAVYYAVDTMEKKMPGSRFTIFISANDLPPIKRYGEFVLDAKSMIRGMPQIWFKYHNLKKGTFPVIIKTQPQ